jgi:hypothetical protein
MALFFECMPQCAQKLLDTADIVRDGDITSTIRGIPLLRFALGHRLFHRTTSLNGLGWVLSSNRQSALLLVPREQSEFWMN